MDNSFDHLTKLLKICTNTLSKTPNLQQEERDECLRLIESILTIIHHHTINSTKEPVSFPPPLHDNVMDFLAQDTPVLRPVSYIRMDMSPFFICKSWLSF